MMTTTVGLAEMYEHAMPAAPPGRGVAPAAGVTTVGVGRVTPSAPPTVEAEGQELVLIAAALVAGAEVGTADLGAAVAALELDDAAEDDDVEVAEPQAARAATAISPVRSDGRVIRWDMGMGTPFVKDPGRRSQAKVTIGYPASHDKWRRI
jgi:hypothetical protein